MSTTSAPEVPEAVWVVDENRCKACGNCVAICPVRALAIGKVSTMTDEASCLRESCRICERQCPEDAIKAY